MSDAALLTTQAWDRTQFIRCYTIGHSWFDYDNSSWNPEFGDPLVLRCERCGSERRDTVGVAGRIVQRSYFYPDGYKYGKGERPSRNEHRAMLMDLKKVEAKGGRKSS